MGMWLVSFNELNQSALGLFLQFVDDILKLNAIVLLVPFWLHGVIDTHFNLQKNSSFFYWNINFSDINCPWTSINQLSESDLHNIINFLVLDKKLFIFSKSLDSFHIFSHMFFLLNQNASCDPRVHLSIILLSSHMS